MMKILFVCLGNICRSPTAEAVMRHLMTSYEFDAQIDSAGTAAYHIGKAPDKRSQVAALKRGIDMSNLKARQAESEDFAHFDYIFAMDKENYRNLEQIRPNNAQAKLVLFLEEYGSAKEDEVPDPYYGGEQGFEHVLNLLEDACHDFLKRHTAQ